MKMANRKGFTMVELLIVLAIIAILAAVAIPVYSSQMEKSRIEVDNSNLRAATGLAAQDYILRNSGKTGATNTTADLEYLVLTYKPNANNTGNVKSQNMMVYPVRYWVNKTNGNCDSVNTTIGGAGDCFQLPEDSEGNNKPIQITNGYQINGQQVMLMPLQQNGGKARFDITITNGGVVKESKVTQTVAAPDNL